MTVVHERGTIVPQKPGDSALPKDSHTNLVRIPMTYNALINPSPEVRSGPQIYLNNQEGALAEDTRALLPELRHESLVSASYREGASDIHSNTTEDEIKKAGYSNASDDN